MTPDKWEESQQSLKYRLDKQEERSERQEILMDKILNRVVIVENSNIRLDERLNGVIEQLIALNNNLRWLMGFLLTGIVGFFFAAVQKGLF